MQRLSKVKGKVKYLEAGFVFPYCIMHVVWFLYVAVWKHAWKWLMSLMIQSLGSHLGSRMYSLYKWMAIPEEMLSKPFLASTSKSGELVLFEKLCIWPFGFAVSHCILHECSLYAWLCVFACFVFATWPSQPVLTGWIRLGWKGVVTEHMSPLECAFCVLMSVFSYCYGHLLESCRNVIVQYSLPKIAYLLCIFSSLDQIVAGLSVCRCLAPAKAVNCQMWLVCTQHASMNILHKKSDIPAGT